MTFTEDGSHQASKHSRAQKGVVARVGTKVVIYNGGRGLPDKLQKRHIKLADKPRCGYTEYDVQRSYMRSASGESCSSHYDRAVLPTWA
jgi:hypothetical protein